MEKCKSDGGGGWENGGEGLKWKRTVNARPVQLLVKAPTTSVQLSGGPLGLFRLVSPVLQLPPQQPL